MPDVSDAAWWEFQTCFSAVKMFLCHQHAQHQRCQRHNSAAYFAAACALLVDAMVRSQEQVAVAHSPAVDVVVRGRHGLCGVIVLQDKWMSEPLHAEGPNVNIEFLNRPKGS